MQRKKIVLFQEKIDCCACGACMNACPVSAISMKEDEMGFLYPCIDEEKCISCGRCISICQYGKNEKKNKSIQVLAAASNDSMTLKNTASGGIFSVLAGSIIEKGGIVYGATMSKEDNTLEVKHIGVENKDEIVLLQGSKYVQSMIGDSYKQVKKNLEAERNVLFSGTPCQVAGLYSYLGKEYDKLITIDIICHGVPNLRWFQEYIEILEKKLNGKIYNYKFRDKSKGQGMNTRVYYFDKKNIAKEYTTNGHLTSFFYFFLQTQIYRENCYKCPYAMEERVADITIGDYWGVYQEHQTEMNKSTMSNSKGVSCILINSKKGLELIRENDNKFEKFESTYKKVARHNEQLVRPVAITRERNELLSIYKKEGYAGIEKNFRKKVFFKRPFYIVESLMPKGIKRKMKQLIKK